MSSRPHRRIGIAFSLKLSALYALFFVIGTMGLFAVAYYLVHLITENRDQEIIRDRMAEYRAWYEEGGIRALKARFDQQAGTAREIFFVRIVGPRNQVLFVSVPEELKGMDPGLGRGSSSSQDLGWLFIEETGKREAWMVGVTTLPGGLSLQVGKSTTQSRELLATFRRVFLLFVIPILLLGIGGAGILTFRAIRPVRGLIQTVRGILETGRTDMRVPVAGERGELHELVSLFNQMLDKNEILIRGMHQSLDHVAHDLRTPMTRLRATGETAFRDPENAALLREALADCMEESERVLSMLDTLMDVAEAETGAMRLQMSEFVVSDLLESVKDLYEFVAEERQIPVSVEASPDLCVRGDRGRLQQVLANLLDNAIKYSVQGQPVHMAAGLHEEWIRISVSDQGMGIPPEEQGKIWERLYRGDQSRSKRGLGLGLSFVKAIVEAHGGRVLVESLPNEGSTFTVDLPAAA